MLTIIVAAVLVLVVLVALGALLADHLMPEASGLPSTALAIEPGVTALDRALEPELAAHPGCSGAILLNHGLDAFAARALAARNAGRSLDLMYYMWHDDLCGRLLALEVWRAAERGVRVRMLLDDMNQHGLDRQMLALDAHPNIEIRLYNPFRNRRGPRRLVEMLIRALRVNHRMHNKAWITDGRLAIVGGRNIGEEYFDSAANTNFRDLDMVLLGPAVAGAEVIFDRYWNSETAVTLKALAGKDSDSLHRFIDRSDKQALDERARAYLARVEAAPGVAAFFTRELHPVWSAQLEVAADPPQKWRRDDRQQWLVRRLVEVIGSARTQAALISPYFVPGKEGTRRLVERSANGVAVGVVTNSLAANDVPAAHAGYARYRKRLLTGGVKLYELRAQGHQETARLFGSSGASLHTKAFVIDARRGFVGSFNLDMRSAALNTEMGVLFDDPEIGAALVAEYLRLAGPALSYSVKTAPDGRLQWEDGGVRPPAILTREPDASFMRRVVASILRWLPIESQL